MVGYGDVPYRGICRRFGSALSYVPLVLDEAVIHGKRSSSPADFAEEERPVALQVVSRDPSRLLAACERLMPLQPDLFDLNLGCPSRNVTGAGRGSALLREPALIGELVSALVRTVPVPVMAKIRLGWDATSRNYLEVAHILEESGAAAIAVHGRTRAEAFRGQADWQPIAEIKSAAHVPILGNGDVRTVADIAAMQAATACDAVLIGRGAIGNPWIFSGHDLDDVPFEERLVVIREHLGRMVAYHGPRLGVICFRKHVVRYLHGLPNAASVRQQLTAAPTADELLAVLESWHPAADSSAAVDDTDDNDYRMDEEWDG
jgi:nifR3 family TIM-barrel protein